MRRIRVRVVRTKRDGVVLKITDPRAAPRQQKVKGRTQRQWDKEARELEDELNRRARQLTWGEFYDRFSALYLDGMSRGHQDKTAYMVKRLAAAAEAKGLTPFFCPDITTELVMDVEAAMRTESLAAATVRSNMATLWGMLSWGMDANLVPHIRRPRQRKGKKAKAAKRKAKGRSLTLEEIERMQAKIPEVCEPHEDPEGFQFAMMAMRLIGLRKSDCWLLRWEPMEGTHYPVNLDGKSPMICYSSEQKSGDDEEVPLTPDAVTWLRSIRKETGWICRTRGARGEHATHNRLGRVISAAGRAAGIIVKPNGGKRGTAKYASSHDLRRTFATTWHQRLTLSELQVLTRHGDAQTLLSYYADAPAVPLAAKLRKYADTVLDDTGGFSGGDADVAPGEDDAKTQQNAY